MSECGDVSAATLRGEIAAWWSQPFWCRIKHAYGQWQTRPVQGFNIAFQLVNGTERFRQCRRCGRYERHARVTY